MNYIFTEETTPRQVLKGGGKDIPGVRLLEPYEQDQRIEVTYRRTAREFRIVEVAAVQS